MAIENANRAEHAWAFERLENRLSLARVGLFILGVVAYQYSGWSAEIAEGLSRRFGAEAWGWTTAAYIALSAFGCAALLSPLTIYADHALDSRLGDSSRSFGEWFADFALSLVVDLATITVLFSLLYALMRQCPNAWWWIAALIHAVFSVGMSAVAPRFFAPAFDAEATTVRGELSDRIRACAKKAGLRIESVREGDSEEDDARADVVFAGHGAKRKVILGEGLLKDYSNDEIIAVVARELGRHVKRDAARLSLVGSLFAGATLFGARLALDRCAAFFGVAGPADVGAAPILVLVLFAGSLFATPFLNAYSRRRSFAADDYAIEAMGAADALVSALEKAEREAPSNPEPAVWEEWFFREDPSMARRIKRARQS